MNKTTSHVSLISLVLTFILVGCGSPESPVSRNDSTSNNSPASSNNEEPNPLEKATVEFKKKLEYYNGALIKLELKDDVIYSQWSSQKCDWFKEEVIDLAVSINRGYSKQVKSIMIKRTCNSNTKEFNIDGEKFMRYKAGQINDREFTTGLK